MSIILGSERGLYDHYIVEVRLDVADFEISKEHDIPGTKKRRGTGDVTVTYKPSGISRQYRDGVIPPPHAEFERELKAGLFKTR